MRWERRTVGEWVALHSRGREHSQSWGLTRSRTELAQHGEKRWTCSRGGKRSESCCFWWEAQLSFVMKRIEFLQFSIFHKAPTRMSHFSYLLHLQIVLCHWRHKMIPRVLILFDSTFDSSLAATAFTIFWMMLLVYEHKEYFCGHIAALKHPASACYVKKKTLTF